MEDAALVSAAGGPSLKSSADLVEAMGSDVLVHFTVDGGRPLSRDVRVLAHDVEDPVELELESGDRVVVARPVAGG
jgi:multiple sugar transport system ATP-binding protein